MLKVYVCQYGCALVAMDLLSYRWLGKLIEGQGELLQSHAANYQKMIDDIDLIKIEIENMGKK